MTSSAGFHWTMFRNLTLLCLLIAAAAGLFQQVSAIEPVISPEFGTDHPVTESTQFGPAISSNGSDWLLVWSDDRAGQFDIYGLLIDAGGRPRTSVFPICRSSRSDVYPLVCNVSNRWVVVWRRGGENRTNEYFLVANTVGADGAVSLNAERRLTSEFNGPTPYLASPGQNRCLVVWAARGNIWGRLVDRNGQPSITETLISEEQEHWHRIAGLARNGHDDWLLTWMEGSDSGNSHGFGLVIDPSGQAHGKKFRLTESGTDQFFEENNVSGRNSEWLVTWLEERSTGDSIWATLVNREGPVAGATGFRLGGSAKGSSPVVASNRDNWLVAWGTRFAGSKRVRGAVVDSNGEVKIPGGFNISRATETSQTGGLFPTIAPDGDRWIVAWRKTDGADTSYHLSEVAPSGRSRAPELIAKHAELSYGPLLVGSGIDGNHVLVRQEGQTRIWLNFLEYK